MKLRRFMQSTLAMTVGCLVLGPAAWGQAAFDGQIRGVVRDQSGSVLVPPETVDGQPFSVLELAERHRGYQGFLPPQADSLMKSSTGR